MCGIAGVWTSGGHSREDLLESVREMANAMLHRGPDDSGEWCEPSVGVAFGFRRLAIIDLSPAGHQPMHSHSGRYTIVFNGEVYNFAEVARELRAADPTIAFRGHADTEVLLEAVERWGLRATLQRFTGMFAFALWDSEERKLHLVRDRLGVKPLYYGFAGSVLLFGSELKALTSQAGFDATVTPAAIDQFMRFGYIPGQQTIYRSVQKLEPGMIATFTSPRAPELTPYWTLSDVVARARAQPFRGSDDDAVEQLDALLRDSVGLRLVSDVPLGVFLSGGVDSSTVVAIAQAVSRERIKTFTIGFPSAEYDEAPYARRVAEHLGTDHHELYVSVEEAQDVIPRLAEMYDEPFADSSQIPTHLVSAMARKFVTVSLSGDGGDELFGGYNRYIAAPLIWSGVSWMPRAARAGLGRALRGAYTRSVLDSRFLPRALKTVHFSDKLRKVSRALRAADADAFYWNVASHPTEGFLVPEARAALAPLAAAPPDLESFAERMMYLDTLTYLPDDILVKVDRASMSVSLEAREPLLDHRLVEFAWRLPLHMRVRAGRGKWLLRSVLHRYVPEALLNRPKTGFTIPLQEWLRGSLRDWAESLLDPRALKDEGVFAVDVIRTAWSEHLSGSVNRHSELWNVLMFRAWNEHRRAARRAGDGRLVAVR